METLNVLLIWFHYFTLNPQWNQECLAYLLRLISQFSVDSSDAEAGHDDVFETYESPRRKMKRKGGNEKIVIPRLNKVSYLNIS